MFQKVRFSDGKEHTAGIVINNADKVPACVRVQEISRLFPQSEIPKMRFLQVSPLFTTFDEAFSYEIGV